MASHRLQLGQLSGMEVDGVPPPMRHSCLVWASSPPIDRIDQPDVFSSQLRTSLVSFWAATAARFPVSPVVAACACRCDRPAQGQRSPCRCDSVFAAGTGVTWTDKQEERSRRALGALQSGAGLMPRPAGRSKMHLRKQVGSRHGAGGAS